MPGPKRRPYKDLSLTQLRSFCAVCDGGGYAAAARALFLTSPAVWEQVQGLERHYGGRLLERDGAKVRPTALGERLLDLVRPLLAGLAATRDVIQQEDGSAPRRLTLVTNLRVLAEEVSRAARRFRARYPGTRLRLFYTGIDEVEPRVLRDEADVAVTLEPGPDRPPPPAVAYEPAGAVSFLLVTPRRHPLARARAVPLARVVRYPLVLGEPGAYSRHRVQEVLHRNGLTGAADVVAETSSDEYTLSCVRAGLGVGITVGTGRGPLYQGLGVRSLNPWFGPARVGFLWKRGAHVPPAQRALADAVRASLAEVAGDG
ncbi:MAG TPA: LysR family transcriptional regulator [Gemmataceae bacterium]|jgi:DNA-binding transcriptional LysR family regulator